MTQVDERCTIVTSAPCSQRSTAISNAELLEPDHNRLFAGMFSAPRKHTGMIDLSAKTPRTRELGDIRPA